MKNFKYIKLLLLSILIAATQACMEDDSLNIVYDGITVEFDRSFASSQGSYLRLDDGQAVQDQIRINLVGAHQDKDITVSWALDEEQSTAIPGLHYNILSNSTVTIPAGESYAYIDFEVFPDEMSAVDNFSIMLKITSSEVEVSSNYSSVMHYFNVVCPSDLPTDYETQTNWELGSGVNDNVTVKIQEGQLTTYDISDITANALVPFGGDVMPGVIEDICGEIYIVSCPSIGFGDVEQDPDQAGYYDEENGEIVLYWILRYGDPDFKGMTVLKVK